MINQEKLKLTLTLSLSDKILVAILCTIGLITNNTVIDLISILILFVVLPVFFISRFISKEGKSKLTRWAMALAIYSLILLILDVRFFIGSLIFILLVGIPLLITILIINKVGKQEKTKRTLWLITLSVVIAPSIIEKGYWLYDQSFTRFDDASMELSDYYPFAQGSKVARLNEPATLKFEAVFLNKPSTLKFSDYLPKLDGARALYPVYAAFGQAVYPEMPYDFDSEIGFHNTIEAYKKLIKREVDMIFVASPSKEQLELAKENQVDMKFTPIGKEAFVFFVNARNPIDGLSSEEIRGIYAGRITNWQNIGGNNQEIRAFQRNEGSGSQSAFIKFMHNTPIMPPPQTSIVMDMSGIIKKTADYANYSNSIGFSFRYFTQTLIANNEIKLLNIDGVYPTQDTMRSGDYPLIGEFYAVTLADNAEPNVQKLLEWILSPQGQYLIEKTGYISIGNPN